MSLEIHCQHLHLTIAPDEPRLKRIENLLIAQQFKINLMAEKLSDLPAILADLKTKFSESQTAVVAELDKATAEITAKLNEIQSNPDLPAEVVTAINDLRQLANLDAARAAAKTADDIVPDVVVEPPPPVVEPPTEEPTTEPPTEEPPPAEEPA